MFVRGGGGGGGIAVGWLGSYLLCSKLGLESQSVCRFCVSRWRYQSQFFESVAFQSVTITNKS